MSDDLMEKCARAAYEKFNENLIESGIEPRWVALEDSFQLRMIEAARAAIACAMNDNEEKDALDPEFAKLDLESLFNLRQWVQAAVEAKGAKVTGAGIGVGGPLGLADIDVEIEDFRFNLEIRPRPK